MKKLLIDNDIFILLSITETWDDWVDILGIEHENIYTLPSLRSMLKSGKKLYRHIELLGDERVKMVQRKAESLKRLILTEEQENYISFFQTSSIDEGESMLFSVLATTENEFMATKDFRCLKELAQQSQEKQKLVKGKIYCAEQMIIALYQKYGFTYLVNHFQPIRHMEKTMEIFFSDGNCVDENSFRVCLMSYMTRRLRDTGDLLATEYITL